MPGGGGGGTLSIPTDQQLTLQNRQAQQLEQNRQALALQRQQQSAAVRAGSNMLGRALLLNSETGLPADAGPNAAPARKLGG
ncbi:hypothetical protein UFOVP99_33 [uncultured Caudovirales phage]|uniref:Uncharacterized protein n=1 Tax=uncultured Caudovirales phage TaxID=2100421 RepID=A0A6J5L138_9CAUD|nr:hypothetical protein UFOVP99_33 [uncultured Caudovirales phage]